MAAPASGQHDGDRSRLAEIIGSIPHAAELAEDLIDEFGTLGAVLNAPTDAIERVIPNQAAALACIQWFGATMRQALSAEIERRPLLGNWQALLDFLHATLAFEHVEQIRALYLNAKNRLIRDEVIARGTVDGVAFYPREIIGRGIALGATALILAHNHPSGDPSPSLGDIRNTKLLDKLCSGVGIGLLDHIIIGRSGTVSLRGIGAITS